MTGGCVVPSPDPDHEDPWAGFEWDLDGPYNIASAALTAVDEGLGDRPALRHRPLDGGTVTLSYRALDDASNATAAALAERGVGAGDRVGVCLPQCPELLVAHLAVYRLGGVVVPLSMLLGDDSLRYSLAHSGTDALVVDEARWGRTSVDADVASVSDVLAVEPGKYGDSALGGLARYATCGAAVSSVETAPDDAALILYTSGTTGKPKGVVQGHQYLAGSLPGYRAWFELFDDESARAARVWTPAEWAWAGALFDVVFPTLAVGGTLVSYERRSGFDPGRSLDLLERERVTHTFMPATALNRIRSAGVAGRDLSSLAVVMSGGEKLPGPVLSWARDALAPTVHETYGQTEANALVGNCTAAYPVRPGSMGKAYPGHDVALVDDDGDPVPEGDLGEVAVRLPDPVVFSGYWEDEAATAAKFRGEFFVTGDLAVRDAEGYLWHRGRKDDLIITAGYRVSPLEVEEALEAHPDVVDTVVGGVPDADRGERVKAYVVALPDADRGALAEELRAFARDRIGAHKAPREIEFVDAIPETRSGKADRSALFDV